MLSEYIQYYFRISPALCKHGTLKTYEGGGCGSKTPPIRNLGCRCTSETSYTPLSPYPRGKHFSLAHIDKVGGCFLAPRALWTLWRRKTHVGIELKFPGQRTCS